MCHCGAIAPGPVWRLPAMPSSWSLMTRARCLALYMQPWFSEVRHDMEQSTSYAVARTQNNVETQFRNDAHASGVSWGAVSGGAFVAAALSLALLALGTGIGLSATSPWANAGSSACRYRGWGAIGWLIAMQLFASALGGYVAGRLRTRWVNVHTHEVYFRDTAHGFLVWAVALVRTAAFLTSAATSLASVAGRARTAAPEPSPETAVDGYLADTLLRTSPANEALIPASTRNEIGVIVAHDLATGNMPNADRTYLAQIVSARSGVSQAEAEKRVDEVFTNGLETGRKRTQGRCTLDVLALSRAADWCVQRQCRRNGRREAARQRGRCIAVTVMQGD